MAFALSLSLSRCAGLTNDLWPLPHSHNLHILDTQIVDSERIPGWWLGHPSEKYERQLG